MPSASRQPQAGPGSRYKWHQAAPAQAGQQVASLLRGRRYVHEEHDAQANALGPADAAPGEHDLGGVQAGVLSGSAGRRLAHRR